MVTGKTESGFEFEIDEEQLDDMEFIELMAAAQENWLKFPAMLEKMLGKEQKARLYDHIKNDKGRVKPEELDKIVTEIFELAGKKLKNSGSSPA